LPAAPGAVAGVACERPPRAYRSALTISDQAKRARKAMKLIGVMPRIPIRKAIHPSHLGRAPLRAIAKPYPRVRVLGETHVRTDV
jgi:hypothetical protein